jgi:2-C-methyl-D-erythritol 4-phosphate cytidylyltransferase
MTLSAPQSFLFKNIQNLYKLAEEKHVLEYVEPHTTNIMAELGVPIYFSKGNQTNIKITTKEDLDLFEGWLLLKNKK